MLLSHFLRFPMSCSNSNTTLSTTSSVSPIVSPSNELDFDFLNEVMTALGLKNINQNSSTCGNCEEGNEVTSKCADCNENLCDRCVCAHKFELVTRDHRINRIAANSNKHHLVSFPSTSTSTSNDSICSTQISNTSNTGYTVTNNFCDIHRELHRLYCETCSTFICSDCILDGHYTHKTFQFSNETSWTNAGLSCDAQKAILQIKTAMDKIQNIIQQTNYNSNRTIAEVQDFFKRHADAIERRERDLISRIEQACNFKSTRLSSQLSNLQSALSKLSNVSEILHRSFNATNEIDMILARETALQELRPLRNSKTELTPCEDESVTFVAPETGILCAIFNLGYVVVNSQFNNSPRPSPIRAETQLAVPEVRPELLVQSRCIYRSSNLVTAKFNGPTPSLVFGQEGESIAELCRPWGICCNDLGEFIVADRSNNRIQIFDRNGTFVRKFGSAGREIGEFDRPAGVTVNHLGHIVVGDKDNHRIQIFDMEGNFILTFGEHGSMNGQFNYPWDVACNGLGHIVVSDTRNHRIQLFTADGIFINKFGYEGNSMLWKHFNTPRGVCFTPQGCILVTDFENHRVLIIDKSLSNAQWLGSEGTNIKQFMRPQGIVCDDYGNIVVADTKNNRIQAFDSAGKFLFKFGQCGDALGDFERPSGICLTPEGRIAVVDFGNNRVAVY